MKNLIIGTVWIVTGIAFIVSGLSAYWQYSTSGIMWLIVILEIIQVKRIALGLISLLIGIRLVKNKNIIKDLISLSTWLLILEIGILLFELIKWQSTHLVQYSLSSLIIVILLLISFKYSTQIKDSVEFNSIVKRQTKRNILIGIILFGVVWLLSSVIDYAFIESLRNK
ncbi:hypothetical protein [Carboxylicivirga marina]|uniref:Uncharacterized protein n=1 Tax=Carboxylicivirga marina TaxID=2800988 RepID=A0ABS1HQP6_9BACT|nr:hypothetical protein [Carboxylicivirga marina]MBK3519987.1 hypothetical protein [Carboxylicivirga marina]